MSIIINQPSIYEIQISKHHSSKLQIFSQTNTINLSSMKHKMNIKNLVTKPRMSCPTGVLSHQPIYRTTKPIMIVHPMCLKTPHFPLSPMKCHYTHDNVHVPFQIDQLLDSLKGNGRSRILQVLIVVEVSWWEETSHLNL